MTYWDLVQCTSTNEHNQAKPIQSKGFSQEWKFKLLKIVTDNAFTPKQQRGFQYMDNSLEIYILK